jgi:hypothetical protein
MGANVVPLAARGVPAIVAISAVRQALWSAPIPVYVLGRPNRCISCHHEAFWVGRITAECGSCGRPLPIVDQRRPM